MTIIISQNITLTINPGSPICTGTSSGSINLTVSGGTSPFTFLWNNGATTEDINGIPSGNYNVTVTDAGGCTANASTTITELPPMILSAAVTNVSCFGASSGSINLTVSGGTSPFTYLWSNGSTSEDLASVIAGNYNVTVTDANACTATISATVGQPVIINASITVTNSSCFGGANGSINLTVSGGTAPYSYLWSNGSTSEDLTGLSAGTYIVNITDAGGCTASASSTITQPATVLAASSIVTNTVCSGTLTGAIDLTVSGGASPYSYLWSNGVTTQDLAAVAAGSYNVTITDASGCTYQTNITINDGPSPITPTFTQLGPYCVGATPDLLPAASLNGISGTWSPATISTAAAGTITYNFTPAAGQCAATTTMAIVVTTSITPTFTQLGPYCVGAAADALPGTSLNGISGTWSPATISTAAAGTITYNFTPAAGQCADQQLWLSWYHINHPYIHSARTILRRRFCNVLPGTSLNGISGTWSPATISTAAAGTITYNFTPAAGQCAATTTMAIVVTTSITPTFTQLGPYCVGAPADALPGTSLNGISGTWSPATISTAAAGTITYNFTPAAGQCAATTTMAIVVTTSITPTFTQLGPYCVGASADALPGTSLNGISGTWSPATISTAAAGTITYNFTPAAGQCAASASMAIVVTTSITPTFTQLGPYCVGASPHALPGTSQSTA